MVQNTSNGLESMMCMLGLSCCILQVLSPQLHRCLSKDGPDHKPWFIGVNFAGCLCIASSKHILGQLLHCRDCLQNHEEHDSWKEGPVTTLGHNTSHSLSWHIISFLFFFSTWLHHQSMDDIATSTSLLCFLPVLLFLLLWSLCYGPTKLPYINRYDMFVAL